MSKVNVHVEGEPGQEDWEVWFDCERRDGKPIVHSGLCIGSGDTFEAARDQAIADMRRGISDLEAMPHPDVTRPVTQKEDHLYGKQTDDAAGR